MNVCNGTFTSSFYEGKGKKEGQIGEENLDIGLGLEGKVERLMGRNGGRATEEEEGPREEE